MGIVSPEARSGESLLEANRRTSHGSTIHNLKLSDGLAFVVLIRRRSCCFSSDDGEFHMLDFYPDQQEIYLSNNHILEVVPINER